MFLGWTLTSSNKIRMLSSGESRTRTSCRSSSILPADADVKLDAGPRHRRGLLCLGDVLRLHTLRALGRLVGDLLALFKGPEPGTLYVGVMDENVPAPVVRGDEAVALLLVEPANCSLGHMLEPAFLLLGPTAIKSRPLVPTRFGDTPRKLEVGR